MFIYCNADSIKPSRPTTTTTVSVVENLTVTADFRNGNVSVNWTRVEISIGNREMNFRPYRHIRLYIYVYESLDVTSTRERPVSTWPVCPYSRDELSSQVSGTVCSSACRSVIY